MAVIRPAGQKAEAYHHSAPPVRVRVLGTDLSAGRQAARERRWLAATQGVVLYADVERKRLVLLEPLAESDAPKLRRHLPAGRQVPPV